MHFFNRGVQISLRIAGTLLLAAIAAWAQDPVAPPDEAHSAERAIPALEQPVSIDKQRVFGVLPNYRTADGSIPYSPISTRRKWLIATKDSVDYPVFIMTGVFAGLSQLQGTANEVYGQGVKGFTHRYYVGYIDQLMTNYFPEAIVPTIFHMDPRYFRKGTGSIGGRLLYAVSRTLICKNDNGHNTVNLPELLGNAMGAAASATYHPHQRTTGDIAEQFGTVVEFDTIGEISKEFWPDIKRILVRHHSSHKR